MLSPKADTAFVLYISVVTEASTSCPGVQLGSHFLQKASPEVVPENSSSGTPSGEGESQPWTAVGMCNVLWGRILVAERLLSLSFLKAKLGAKKGISIY